MFTARRSKRSKRMRTTTNTETLEVRQLLTAISFSNGVVTLNGSATADQISAKAEGKRIRFDVNGASRTFNKSQVNQIVARGRGGNDRITNATSIALRGSGGAGNDTIISGDGSDTLSGDKGVDSLVSGRGNDTVYGGGGRDRIKTGRGNDLAYAGDGNDLLWMGSGDDTVWGSNGRDRIRGGSGKDYLLGESGNDTIDAGSGDDTVLGSSGADSILGRSGDDELDGGDGNDWIDAWDGHDVVWGNNGNDSLYGYSGDDSLVGGAGDDFLSGEAGSDAMWGQSGTDTLIGGADRNWYFDSDQSLRADIWSFSPEDRTAIASAIWEYITPEIVHHHQNDPMMQAAHRPENGELFLNMHRMMIQRLETHLSDRGLALPLWDPGTAIPQEFTHVKPVGSNTSPLVNLNPNMPAASWQAAGIGPAFMNRFLYGNAQSLGVAIMPWHNAVHVEVGGVMANTASPSALVFWAWHGYIDEMYATWERS